MTMKTMMKCFCLGAFLTIMLNLLDGESMFYHPIVFIVTSTDQIIDSVKSSMPKLNQEVPGKRFENPTEKKIVLWNDFFGDSNWSGLMISNNKTDFFISCNRTCLISRDRSHTEYDAFIFHVNDPHNAPPRKKPAQLYIAFNLEPPPKAGYLFRRGSFYDMSIMPNRHSTVQFVFSFTYNISLSIGLSNYGVFKETFLRRNQKRKNGSVGRALAIMSNCWTHSRRNVYIYELKKHFPVDIYGGCGKKCTHKLDAPNDGGSCFRYLASTGKYKYYLSFENSVCQDYITEKVTDPLHYGLLPIVLGGLTAEEYSKPGFLPPDSYLDVRNFTSPKHLAQFLHKLDKDDERYLSYHKWRRQFTVEYFENTYTWLCDTCDALYHPIPRSHNAAAIYSESKVCDSNLVQRLLGLDYYSSVQPDFILPS